LCTYQSSSYGEDRDAPKLKRNQDNLDYALERAVAQKLGKRLGVDTAIFDSVSEYVSEYMYKSGLDEARSWRTNIRSLDIETGKIPWDASRSETGGCSWFCQDSLNRLVQKVCS